MTFQETRNLLNDIKKAKQLCLRLRREIDEVRSDYGALTSSLCQNEVRGHCSTPTALRLIERLEAKQEMFEKALTKMMSLEDRLSKEIFTLSPVEQDIIIGYYMHDRTNYQIAYEINYCEKQVIRIKNKAIAKIARRVKT